MNDTYKPNKFSKRDAAIKAMSSPEARKKAAETRRRNMEAAKIATGLVEFPLEAIGTRPTPGQRKKPTTTPTKELVALELLKLLNKLL